MVALPRKPRRVVVCVDGTWFKPDGEQDTTHRNFTNIFRIFSVVQTNDAVSESEKDAESLRAFEQRKKYWAGVGTDSSKLSKITAGAWGTGCDDLVREVYEYCCREATLPCDEVFMFGYSRGAYVIRAVASLLRTIRAIKVGSHSFKEDFKKGLKIYEDLLLEEGPKSPGECTGFLGSKTRAAPKVAFVGCLDTVKARFGTDKVGYDISVMDSVARYRQALAMNEQRTVFKPEMLSRRKRISDLILDDKCTDHVDYLDAWFLGTHADLGGSNACDGLSLYPLQWMLSEARRSGLDLGFQMYNRDQPLMKDIRDVIFPVDETWDDEKTNAKEIGIVSLPNGIEIAMWDMRDSHLEERYRLRVNVAVFLIGKLGVEEKPRRVFESDQLLGHRAKEAIGTFIHPCVYMLQDHYPHIRLGQRLGFYDKELQLHRKKYGFRFTEAKQMWPRQEDILPYQMSHARILVCGHNGIGKSTLINKVFSIDLKNNQGHVTEVSHGKHGQHDIWKEIKHPSHDHIIIHDSCGFQPPGVESTSTTKNEVQRVYEFLQHRLQHENFDERLHVIWYCVDVSKERYLDEADKDLFRAIDASNSRVPIVLVLTKKDAFKNKIIGKELPALMISQPELASDPVKMLKMVGDDAEKTLQSTAEKFRKEFLAITKSKLIGPILTDENDESSFDALLKATLKDVNSSVSALIIAAQTRNVHLKRQQAIEIGMDLFRAGTRTSCIPIPLTTTVAQATCGALICERALKAFGYDNINSDMVWAIVKNNWEGSLAAIAGQITVAAACVTAVLLFPPSLFLALASDTIVSVATVTRQARVLVLCIVDVIMILDKAFWVRADFGDKTGIITDEDIRTAFNWYNSISESVHEQIKKRLPVLSAENNTVWKSLFNADQVQSELEVIIEEHRFRPRTEEKS